MSESTPAATAAQSSSSMVIASSSLLIAVVEEASDILLHGSEGEPSDPTLWYLDTGATNHMTGRREFLRSIDKSTMGFVKFGDNSKIRIEGRGDIEITQKDGKVLQLSSVLYVPNLSANILSLGRVDEEGCRMTMARGKLTIFDYEDQLLAQVQRSEGRLYLLKLNVVDQCLITTKDNSEDRLWHSRYGHLNFHTLKEMSRLKMVEGLPQIEVPINFAEFVWRENNIGVHFRKAHNSAPPNLLNSCTWIYAD